MRHKVSKNLLWPVVDLRLVGRATPGPSFHLSIQGPSGTDPTRRRFGGITGEVLGVLGRHAKRSMTEMPGLGTKGKAMVELEDMERVFRGAESGHQCTVGTRKKELPTQEAKVDRHREVEGSTTVRGWAWQP